MTLRFNRKLGSLLLFSLILPAAAFAEGQEVAKGSFVGQSGHKASGEVSVQQTDAGSIVVLKRSFNFDGAPDPKLAFGKKGYDESTQFSPLRSNSGEQSYEIPASIDPANYDEVWIWCEKYSVPLGVAKLN